MVGDGYGSRSLEETGEPPVAMRTLLRRRYACRMSSSGSSRPHGPSRIILLKHGSATCAEEVMPRCALVGGAIGLTYNVVGHDQDAITASRGFLA